MADERRSGEQPSGGQPSGEHEPGDGRAELGRELERPAEEPLLAVEVKLMVWSLVLGAVLLGVLVWLSETFFAA